MTLEEIADFVCAKVGAQDEDSVAIAKSFATKRHKMVWDSHLWRDSVTSMSQAVDQLVIAQAGTVNPRYVVFRNHPEVEHVLAVCDDNTAYSPEELVSLFWSNPEAFSATGGNSGLFTPMRRTPLWYGPDALELLESFFIQCRCTTLLTAVTVTLIGRNANGISTSSSVTLTDGTYKQFFPQLREVWKMETSNNAWSTDGEAISFSAVDDDTFFIGSLAEGGSLKAPTFPVIRVGAPITASGTIRAVGKLSCPTFEDDDDEPGLRNIDNALIAFVESDMLARQRQRGKAGIAMQEGAAHVKGRVDEERKQSASNMRIIPHVEPTALNARYLGPNKAYF